MSPIAYSLCLLMTKIGAPAFTQRLYPDVSTMLVTDKHSVSDERIIQHILNVKPSVAGMEVEAQTSGKPFSVTSSPTWNSNSNVVSSPQTQNNELPSASSSAASANTRKGNGKGGLTATLGCYESFEEEDDHLSTNSLLVHEKKLNEQVRSHLTKSQAQSSTNSTTTSSRMPFFFGRKKNAEAKERELSRYANGMGLHRAETSPPSSPTPAPVNVSFEEPTTPPVKMTPRPWYKRSSSKDKSSTPSTAVTPSTAAGSSRAKPSISVLTNISELDRQAAEIVEEKKRRSALEQNESAKQLITMFNTTFSSTSTSPSTPKGVTNATIVTLPPGASGSGTGSGSDERKKLAIVQPQANTNFKAQTRPMSTPNSGSSSIFGNRSPLAIALALGGTGTTRLASTLNTPAITPAAPVPAPSTEDWACPRCTLQNAYWRSFCDACHFRQGSTVVHSMASMFETVTTNANGDRQGQAPERSSGSSSSATVNPPVTVSATATTVPPAVAANSGNQTSNRNPPSENLLSHAKEKSDKDKKLDGIKLHADDPEVEELDLEKLREARLAFFSRHKVSSPPSTRDTRPPMARWGAGSQNSTQSQASQKKSTSNNLNRLEDDDFDLALQLHQELNANVTNSGPRRWRPINPEPTTSRNSNPAPELDSTFKNWHLKLSELDELDDYDDDGGRGAITANRASDAFIRNMSTEIKDQLNYFDRLKTQLRQQRTTGDLDEDDFSNSEFSESDASTVIDAANFDSKMESRRRRHLQEERWDAVRGGASHHYNGESSRRRISLGDPTPASSRPLPHEVERLRHARLHHGHGYGSFEQNDERHRDRDREYSDYDNSSSRPHRSHSEQPEMSLGSNNPRVCPHMAAGSVDSERRKLSRELEHSASAISKQLRKLEWAINVGDHKLAASLAHDLAILKAKCKQASEEKSVDAQPQPQPITIRVYVEDRVMQQGPFQVPVTTSTTVKELKTKIECDWGIPVLFQKWILGRKIAEDDSQTLAEYEVVHDSMAFLYLVTPNNGKPESNGTNTEDSVQIMAHLAKSPPISRKAPLQTELNIVREEAERPIPGGPANVKQLVPIAVASANPFTQARTDPPRSSVEKTNSSFALKSPPTSPSQGIKSNKSNQVKPVAREIPNESKPSLAVGVAVVRSTTQPSQPKSIVAVAVDLPSASASSSPRKGSTGQIEAAGSASVTAVIPKSSKTVTSKYIESVKQTNQEEPLLSPENSILKQSLHGEKVIKKVTKPETASSMASSANAADPTKVHPLVKSQQLPLPELINWDSDTTRSNDPRSAAGKVAPKIDMTVVNVERLLETGGELSKKAINGHGQKRPVEKVKKEIATGSSKPFQTDNNESRASHDKHAPNSFQLEKVLPKIGSRPQNQSNGGQSQAQIAESKGMRIACDANFSGAKPPTGAGQSKVSVNVLPTVKSPVTNPKVVKLQTQTQTSGNNNSVPKSGPAPVKPELASNSQPVVPVASPQPSTSDAKPKNRWSSVTPPKSQPQPQTSSINADAKKGDERQAILVRRKDSDAIDINLLVEEAVPAPSLPKVECSKSSSSLGATEGARVPEKKEDNTETYRKMLQLMENEDCVRNTEELDCPICFNKVAAGAGVTLRDCLHSFCRECLAGTIQYSDEPQVKCPFRDNNYSCDSFLQEREIKGLVSPAMFERHLAQAVKLAENKIANTFHCQTNDCTGWCIFEDDVNVFKCPVCRKTNCLTCQAIHEGKNCQEYQRELAINAETDEGSKSSRIMLEKMIQRGEALECPACHVCLLKKWGCDWIRCSYCKTEICWVTKSFRWGKNGKGDTSGGCKCGVNGVKCHPKCTYCH